MNELPVTWLVARASGILALGLLTLSVVAGLILKTRPFGKLVKGQTAIEIHRSLSIAGLAAIAIHGLALVLDKTVEITWGDLLLPGAAPYRPVWTAFGVIAAELMLLVAFSFRFRQRIGVKTWRRLHFSSYAIFALAVLHGVFAGSDTGARWMQLTYVVMIALVVFATTFRVVSPAPPRPEVAGGKARTRAAVAVPPSAQTVEMPTVPAGPGPARPRSGAPRPQPQES